MAFNRRVLFNDLPPKRILHRKRGVTGVLPTPEVAIESLDLRMALSYFGEIGNASSWSRFDAYHRNALLRLQDAGAKIALIASNTPHYRLEAITTVSICRSSVSLTRLRTSASVWV